MMAYVWRQHVLSCHFCLSLTVHSASGSDIPCVEMGDDNSFADNRVASNAYSLQFAHMYFCRLRQLMPVLRAAASMKWPLDRAENKEVLSTGKILEVVAGRECIIFGILFLEISGKPNVLHDLGHDLVLSPMHVPESYVSNGSKRYFLEDESGRIALQVPDNFLPVSGMCIACRGFENSDGQFLVTDFCLPGAAPISKSATGNSKYEFVILASGVDYGNDSCDGVAEFQLLVDCISGAVGHQGNVLLPSNAELAHVMLVGNSLAKFHRIDDGQKKRYGSSQAKYELEPLKSFDQQVDEMCQSVPVTILPGARDPTNLALPQNPIHAGMLPNASMSSNLSRLTNPAILSTHGVEFCLIGGQTLNDMARYFPTESCPSRLELARMCMESRLLAPTAPDTVWCRPYSDADPFVLRESPHYFIVGDQPEFATDVVEESNTRIILVPNFSTLKSVVLLNLADGSCKEIRLVFD